MIGLDVEIYIGGKKISTISDKLCDVSFEKLSTNDISTIHWGIVSNSGKVTFIDINEEIYNQLNTNSNEVADRFKELAVLSENLNVTVKEFRV